MAETEKGIHPTVAAHVLEILRDMPPGTVVEDTVEATYDELPCEDCGAAVFIAPEDIQQYDDGGKEALCEKCQNHQDYQTRYDLPPSKRPEEKPLEGFPWIVDMRVAEARRDFVILRGDWGAVGNTEVFLPVPKDMIHHFTYGTRVHGELRVTINRKHEKGGEA